MRGQVLPWRRVLTHFGCGYAYEAPRDFRGRLYPSPIEIAYVNDSVFSTAGTKFPFSPATSSPLTM